MALRRRGVNTADVGFTLIEVVCVLVLLVILVLVSTRMFTNMLRGYILARNSDAVVQKAQNAMQRMTVDFTYLDVANSSGGASSITYNMALNNTTVTTISQVGNRILYNCNSGTYILTDGVKSGTLAFNYYNTYSSAAAASLSSNTTLIGFSYTMVGDDTSQGLSQNYATRVVVNKVQ